jgi:hypothetical protein
MTDTKYTTMTLQIQMRQPVGSALLVANLEDHIVPLDHESVPSRRGGVSSLIGSVASFAHPNLQIGIFRSGIPRSWIESRGVLNTDRTMIGSPESDIIGLPRRPHD